MLSLLRLALAAGLVSLLSVFSLIGCERFTQKKDDPHAGESAAGQTAHEHHDGETPEEHAAHEHHEGETPEEHAAHEHHEGESSEEHAQHDHDGQAGGSHEHADEGAGK
jgi:hypothetical protein